MGRTALASTILLAAGLSPAVLFPAARASAQLCPPDSVGCYTEDVDFQHRSALFDDVMLDSGWVPAGSPVQVRFAVFIGTSTQVDLGATSMTAWPAALDQWVLGRAGTGRLAIDYGIEIIAMVRIDGTFAGIHYNWEGDIPIGDIPRDLRVAAETTFDPFLFPPAIPAMVADDTERVTLYELDITDSIIPIPGVGGGLRVDAAATLEATYRTDRIEITDATSDILEEGASVLVRPAPGLAELGAAKDVVILPHGTIGYTGTITVYPTLFLEFPGGGDYELVLAEVPLEIVDTESNTDFNTETVHVPLPDIRVEPTSLEYGVVPAGGTAEQLLTVFNDGEAALDVTIAEPAAPFTASRTVFTVPPRSSVRIAVTFAAPPELGPVSAALALASNDPDEPHVSVRLNAGVEASMGDADGGVGDGGLGTVTDGGCGCHAGTSSSTAWPLVGLLGLLVVRRRRT